MREIPWWIVASDAIKLVNKTLLEMMSEFKGNGPCVSKVKSGKTGFIFLWVRDLYLNFLLCSIMMNEKL
jgi:hypothetical protein